MTSERLGEMFEGNFADMFVDFFPLVSIGGCAVQGVQTRERGRPSAPAEIYTNYYILLLILLTSVKRRKKLRKNYELSLNNHNE